MDTKLINEMQETLNQLKNILKEQKEDIIRLIEEEKRKEKKKEQIKKDYRINIEEYIKYNQLKTLNDLDKIKVKENDKYFKEKIQHSKSMINEIHSSKYNKIIINNLEDFISI